MSDPVDRVDRGRGEGEKTNDADKHFGQKREIRRKSMVGEDDGGKHDLGDRVGFADRARNSSRRACARTASISTPKQVSSNITCPA
jgi:hypothetical protein